MIPGSANPLLLASAAPVAAYNIERSLRFNSADSAYLSRTPASAGNRKTWTWAGWVKKTTNGSYGYLFDSNISGTQEGGVRFLENDSINVWQWNGSADVFLASTNAVFRDNSAWLHLVVAFDTTQATAANRIKVYINGTQATLSGSYPTQNADANINAAVAHAIGRQQSGSRYFSGYLADVHLVDGQALDPTSFGEFDANNVWQPKAYTGSYGTNGFKINFSNNSAATAAALGADSSGNGHNWTPTNLSVTAGAGNDSLVDSPTNYGTDTGAGGQVRGNYCTMNPIVQPPTSPNVYVYKNGNLDVDFNHAADAAGYRPGLGTIAPSSGKWYWEVVWTSGTYARIGVQNATVQSSNFGEDAGGWRYESNTGNITNGTTLRTVSTYAINDVIGIALDCDSGKLYVSKNGTWQNSAVPASGTGAVATNIPVGVPIYPAATTGGFNTSMTFNFGQRPFAYTAPSSFKALCTANLPTPTIANPATAMDVLLWTGDGSSPRTLSGLGFEPDLVWLKSRSISGSANILNDQVRGANKRLSTDSTAAEDPNSLFGYLSAFTSTGFTVTSGAGGPDLVNRTNDTYVAWAWDAGSSTVTNTSGTITSQVRANASAGFSIVTWTGNGATNATVGHGLNTAPLLYIVKRRDSTSNWVAFLTTLVAPSGGNPQRFLNLNNTDAAANASQALPSSTVLTVLSVFDNINSATYVAYCFAPVAGYSSFGSYTGNGSADGPFIHLGFRPAFVIIKCSSATGFWVAKDYKRAADYNPATGNLYPNDLLAEDVISTVDMDFLANGIKIRGTYSGINANTATYVYAAWASSPFAYARAR